MMRTICLLVAASPLFLPALLAQNASGANGDLRLRDFKPKTRLIVKETDIVHARFPVIDVHFHMNPDAGPSGKLIPADDPRFDPVWDACADLKIPVLLSLTLDKRSSWYGKVDVTFEQLRLELEHIIAKHPRTTFISAHVGMNYEDLAAAARWLDTYPNLYYDIAASYKHLGRQPYSARRFLIEYQDRILFGCDIGRVPALDVYRYMFRVLETDDEYFQHVEPNAGLPWRIYGLYLPDPVLEKIYRLNAIKLLPPFRDRL